jgi:hypothetical protein
MAMSADDKKVKRCWVCAKPMSRADVCFTICNACAQLCLRLQSRGGRMKKSKSKSGGGSNESDNDRITVVGTSVG